MKPIRALGLCGVSLLSLVPMQGCTDLTETPASAITPENFYRNEAEVLGGLASVYAMLRNDGVLWGYYNISEISTDEMIVPTRGQDWFDNGRWLEIHRQAWTATSPAGLEDAGRVWNDSYRGVARANVLLDALQRVTVANQAVIVAELRTLRAYYYYLLLDMFGGVPIATDIEIKARPRPTRAELFDFIEAELKDTRTVLPLTRSAGDYGRLTKGAADAILANMYVNAQVFTGTVTTGGLTPGAARWQDAINFCDSILNSGVYSLSTLGNWRNNFTHDNQSSPENIFVANFISQNDQGLNFVMRALHYNQFTPSPWNGFSTLAETYRAFDANDQRRQIFLVGPQVNLETGAPTTDRGGQPLVFTDTIGDATSARENEGARILKYPPDPAHVAQNNGNDFAFFRLGEIYLIKAEAQFELGNSAGALVLLNQLRARVFTVPQPLAAVDRDVILQERLFELTGEGKRRQDRIRHGSYLNQWSTTMLNGKVDKNSEPYRILLPIPQPQLDANPLLVQNPGY
ncbi:MAG: RagB/SusD family nutrient uptake outer membrane protein [Gemmatimonadales bacterium]